ncbi:MAG: Crp/Fnr family transcriptional regulator [Bacteroidota bacterium]
MENLKRKVRSYCLIPEDDLNYTLQFYRKVERPKGEFVINAGQFVRHWYYVEKGCLCYYTLKDGRKQVVEFFSEDEFFTDIYAFVENIPSNCFVETMEDCVLYVINKDDVQRSYDYSHQVERFGRISMQETLLKVFRRVAHVNNLSNEERYLRLMEKRPRLFQRVPQYLIASYLGLTPVGLSKIRKRLSSSSDLKL